MITLVNGNVQSPGGVLVPNGSITLILQQDCVLLAAPGQVVSAIPVTFRFDASGKLIGKCQIYSNAELSPSTGYNVNIFDADGATVNADTLVWVFNQAANSTVDIGTMVSTGAFGPSYANPFILLQTEGVTNGNQNKLNIATGNGLSAVDNGTGTVTLNLTNVAAIAHQFFTSVVGNALVQAQPAFSDLSGTIASAQIPSRTASIDFVIDGGGSVPSTGAKGQISVPVNCTVSQWILTADAAGSAVIDVLRSTYTAFPTTASIAGTDKPTLSAVQKNRNTGPLSNWGSTALVAGDELQINLNSVTTCTRLNLTLVLSVPWS